MGLRLKNGDRVCIIGGGPAGSLAALHLLQLMGEENLELEVMIFEPRDFSVPGPGGCNRCAGILSTRLVQGLETLGITLPEEVIQSRIQSYAANLDGEAVQITKPDVHRRIVSVYRGSGPRLLKGEPRASFDGFLLEQAQRRGAKHIHARVHSVTWEEQPVVHTARDQFRADLVVLATGVNSRSPLSPDFHYHPPRTAMMAQDEILRPAAWPEDQVNIFFNQPPGLIFGALIPKADYVNISLLGEGFTKDTVEDFIELQGLNKSFPNLLISLCGCTPRIAISSARHFYGSRWVAVGDAAVTRLYKDGIGSAFSTSKIAMQVAVRDGISRKAFQKRYARYCQQVVRDNQYGRLLFYFWNISLQNPKINHVWYETLRIEADELPEHQVNSRLLWGMFTGDESYRAMFWKFASWGAIKSLLRGWRKLDSRKRG